MSAEKILVVDDEPNIVQLARLYLEREGFRIESVSDGNSALQALETGRPDLVILDVMLPEVDGLEVCRRLRGKNNQVPILMLTARDEDIDKILGLEMGADDYMTKPFNPRELVARVKAILRRSGRSREQHQDSRVQLGDLIIDQARREVLYHGKLVDLRMQEFEVLLVLAQSPGQVFSREKLLNLAWGYDFYGQTRTVDVHIAQLRKKLAAGSIRIETVAGIGYKLIA